MLFPKKWEVKYVDIGIHAPVYKFKRVRARDLKEALRKAEKHRPYGFRVDKVKQLRPKSKRNTDDKKSGGSIMMLAGFFLLVLALISPAIVYRANRTVHVNFHAEVEPVTPVTLAEDDPGWSCDSMGNGSCSP